MSEHNVRNKLPRVRREESQIVVRTILATFFLFTVLALGILSSTNILKGYAEEEDLLKETEELSNNREQQEEDSKEEKEDDNRKETDPNECIPGNECPPECPEGWEAVDWPVNAQIGCLPNTIVSNEE